jgi:hypothetical protein
MTAEEKLDALRKFRGDIHIYHDGKIAMLSTVEGEPDSWGADWDKALERLVRRQREGSSKRKLAREFSSKPD